MKKIKRIFRFLWTLVKEPLQTSLMAFATLLSLFTVPVCFFSTDEQKAEIPWWIWPFGYFGAIILILLILSIVIVVLGGFLTVVIPHIANAWNKTK